MSRYETGDALPYEWSEPVYGDVRHHRARIEQLKEWVDYWVVRTNRTEAEVRRLKDENHSLRVQNAILRLKPKYGPLSPEELEVVAAVFHDDTIVGLSNDDLYTDLPEWQKNAWRNYQRIVVDRVLYILNNREESN